MGWCAGTEVMDTALRMAETLAGAALMERSGYDPAVVVDDSDRAQWVDKLLRPFVRDLADKLHRQDWDCADESAFFRRFPQEMLGHDDRAFLLHAQEQAADWAHNDTAEARYWLNHADATAARIAATATGERNG